MATAVEQAVDTKTLQAQYDALRSDTQRAQSKLKENEDKLAAACSERDAIAIDIVRGKRAASDATKIQTHISELEMRINGARRIIESNTPQLQQWSGELSRRAREAALAQRKEEIAELEEKTRQDAELAIAAIREIATDRLGRIAANMATMMSEFLDVGGPQAAERIARLFSTERGKDLVLAPLIECGGWAVPYPRVELPLCSLFRKTKT